MYFPAQFRSFGTLVGGFIQSAGAAWSRLVFGNGLSQAINLVALAVLARATSIEIVGGIAIIQGFCFAVDGLLNFRSGVPLTKYGTEYHAQNRLDEMAGIMKAGFALEVVSAIAAGTLCVVALVSFPGLIGVPDEIQRYAWIYSVVVFVSLPGLPISVFRVYNRFGLIAVCDIAGAATRLVLVGLCWWQQMDSQFFLFAFLAGDVIVRVLNIVLSQVVLYRMGVPSLWQASSRKALQKAENFWRMVWATNMTTSGRALTETGDLVLAGYLLGPTVAGLLRVAKSLAAPLLMVGSPVQQVLFTRLTGYWIEGRPDRLRKEALAATALTGSFGFAAILGAYFLGSLFILIIAGEGFAAASPLLSMQVVAYAVYLLGITLLPICAALEKMDIFFIGTVAGVLFFFGFASVATPAIGSIAIPLASALSNFVWAAVVVFFLRQGLWQKS